MVDDKVRSFGAWGVLLLGATVGCSAPAGTEAGESVTADQEKLTTITVAGIGTASPERGTTLGTGVTTIPTVTTPRATAFTTPVVDIPGLTSTAPPPDPIGDVGPNHYVQAVNGPFLVGDAHVSIYNKQGATLSPSTTDFRMEQLVTDTGPCGTESFGDPMVNYDPLADRWLLSQIPEGENHLCIYISDSGNPAALDHWTLYDFDLDTLVDAAGNPVPGFFPDFPKIAVWPDAYYVSSNDVSPNQMGAYAIDRAAMLQQAPAQIQRFVIPNLPIPVTFPYQPAGVVDFDGRKPPPAGTPGMFVRKVDDEALSPPGNTPNADALEIWELRPNFTTPANSTLTGPTTIAIQDFDQNIASLALFNDAVDQPGTSQKLSVIGSLVGAEWRVQYRNFGGFESLVGNFDVDAGNDDPAPHWFELRRSNGSAWALREEQTFVPDGVGTNDRWMGSVAMDGSGNIALGYSISSATLFPSIRYSGRRATDPLGTLQTTEGNVVTGLASQTDFDRWGDYSSMNVDPADDCTFWYTSMYYAAAGSTRSTRVAAFGFPFPACTPSGAACVYATQSAAVRDRARINRGTLPIGALINSGSGLTEIGVQANTGDILSIGNVTLHDRSVVNGVVQTQGTIAPGNNIVVTGGSTQHATLNLPPPLDISGVVFPAPTGGVVTVNPDQTASRPPGSYAAVTVYSRARLRLTAGRYFFTSLDIEPMARLEVNESAGPVVIFVKSSIIYRGSIVTPANALATIFLGYTGTQAVTLEAPFNGTFVAPNASLMLGVNTSIQFRGQYVAKTFELRPDSVITCDTSASNDAGPL